MHHYWTYGVLSFTLCYIYSRPATHKTNTKSKWCGVVYTYFAEDTNESLPNPTSHLNYGPTLHYTGRTQQKHQQFFDKDADADTQPHHHHHRTKHFICPSDRGLSVHHHLNRTIWSAGQHITINIVIIIIIISITIIDAFSSLLVPTNTTIHTMSSIQTIDGWLVAGHEMLWDGIASNRMVVSPAVNETKRPNYKLCMHVWHYV